MKNLREALNLLNVFNEQHENNMTLNNKILMNRRKQEIIILCLKDFALRGSIDRKESLEVHILEESMVESISQSYIFINLYIRKVSCKRFENLIFTDVSFLSSSDENENRGFMRNHEGSEVVLGPNPSLFPELGP